ncbi:hypothetical protein ACQ5SK_26705 [Bradyrhizobium japonicum]
MAYFAIKSAFPDRTDKAKIQIDLNGLNPAQGLVAIAEVIDLSSGLAKPPIVTLIAKADTGDAVKTLREAMLDGAGEQQTLEIDASKLKKGDIAALARVTVNLADAAAVLASLPARHGSPAPTSSRSHHPTIARCSLSVASRR